MKLIETFVEIKAKDDAMKAGLKSASKYAKSEVREMQRVFNSLKFHMPDFRTLVAGAAGLYGVKTAVDQLIGSTVKYGSALNDMSARTGVAEETLSALGHVAKLAGADMDSVEKSVKYLTNQMLDASRGTGEARKTFKELNIAVTDSKGALRPAVDVMMDAADAIGKMTNETQQAAYAAEMFGARTGTALIPILKLGSAGMREAMNEAKRLGIVMSKEDAAAADAAGDAMDTFTAALEGTKRSIAVGVLPAMTEFIKATTELLASNRELIKVTVSDWLNKIGAGMAFLWSHRETIKTVFEAAAIVLITTKLVALAKAIGMITVALTALGTSAGLTALVSAAGPLAAIATILTAGGLLAMNNFKIPPTAGFQDKVAFRDRRIKGASTDTRGLGYDITAGTGLGAASLYDFESFYAANNRTGTASRGGGTGAGAGAGGAGLFRMQMSAYLLSLSRFTNTGMLGAGGQFTPGADFGKYKAGYYKDDYMKDIEEQNKEQLDAASIAALEYIDIQNDMWSEAKGAALQYSQYWGSVMGSMYQQADGSFRRILDAFRRMIESMMVEAAFVGILNMLTGGAGGFFGGFKSVFSGMLPGKAAGGPVYAGNAYMVGERGPEMFVPRQSGKIIPNGGAADNSKWELHFHDTASERQQMTYDDDAVFAQKFKRCVRDRRITIKAG